MKLPSEKPTIIVSLPLQECWRKLLRTANPSFTDSSDIVQPDSSVSEDSLARPKVVSRFNPLSLTPEHAGADFYVPKSMEQSLMEYRVYRQQCKPLQKEYSNSVAPEKGTDDMQNDQPSACSLSGQPPKQTDIKEDSGKAIAGVSKIAPVDCEDTLTIDTDDYSELFVEDKATIRRTPPLKRPSDTDITIDERRNWKRRRPDDRCRYGSTRIEGHWRRMVGSTCRSVRPGNHGTTEDCSWDSHRHEWVLKSLRDPQSRRLLFVNTVIEKNVLLKFAVATSNTFCEGTGVPFDLARKKSVARKNCGPSTSSSYVCPNDLVKFAVRNTDSLPIVVCGSYDRDSMLLDECCCRRPLSTEYLTKGKHICCLCFPRERRAAYVTRSSRPRLFCEYHARNEMHSELLLYLPVVVAMNITPFCIRLSVIEGTFAMNDTTAGKPVNKERSVQIAVRMLQGRRVADDDVILSQFVEEVRSRPAHSTTIGPVDVIKCLQKLCLRFEDLPTRPRSPATLPSSKFSLRRGYPRSIAVAAHRYRK